MLNEALGSKVTLEVGDCLRSELGRAGHAVYGPYERLEVGDYEVEFLIRRADLGSESQIDELCAMIDVAADNGTRAIAYEFVFASQLGDDFTRLALPFQLNEPAIVEYRVKVSGRQRLDVAGSRMVRTLTESAARAQRSDIAPVLVHHRGHAKSLYDGGGTLAVVGGRLQASLQGIFFSAHEHDDVNFVDELFNKKAYNFSADRPTCVVDIGMNVALASLQFAAKPNVEEVHSFEPFLETFERASRNLAMNPTLAARITAYNFGLGDGDRDATFYVGDTGGDSGSQSARSVEGGRPVQLKIRDAGEVLRPILRTARDRGLATVVKIDCEGAEFDVFQSISRMGLWNDIDLLMVEWHRVFEGRTQDELIVPLRRAGFMVVDVSPDHGNGFFYAARIAG